MEIAVSLFVILFLIFLNAFFVASEFSLVAVRKTRIDELAKKRKYGALLLQRAINDLDKYISATQLGITIASIALGWVGEPFVSHLLQSYVGIFPLQLREFYLHTVSFLVSFAFITFLHIVFGELVPKTIALQKAEKTALAIIIPLQLFMTVFKPFIWFLQTTGHVVLLPFGLSSTIKERPHSEEEVKMILTQSSNEGAIPKKEVDMVYGIFSLGDTPIKKIMTPKHKVIAFDSKLPLFEVIKRVEKNPHSRFPIYRKIPDRVIGFIHIKDIYNTALQGQQHKTIEETKVIREGIKFPETLEADKVMKVMREKRIHMAVLYNKNKKTVGIVTLEDVLENVVGEIEDEFENRYKIKDQVGAKT